MLAGQFSDPRNEARTSENIGRGSESGGLLFAEQDVAPRSSVLSISYHQHPLCISLIRSSAFGFSWKIESLM